MTVWAMSRSDRLVSCLKFVAWVYLLCFHQAGLGFVFRGWVGSRTELFVRSYGFAVCGLAGSRLLFISREKTFFISSWNLLLFADHPILAPD